MKNFKQLIKELPSSKVVVAFGSFQPPTSVHEHLVKAVKTVAGTTADYTIYASANEDKKYNPLSVDRKVYFLNRMFPGTNFQETAEQTIVGLAKKLNEKYKVLTVVVGEDKVADVTKQLTKANGKEYTFESIKVISTGITDPDSDLTPGVSGLRMCESAKAGKFSEFKKGLPHTLTEHDSRRLMNEVRKGLGQEPIKEVVQFERTSVREQYIAGDIFNVGDKVQDENGTYEIMDRGANYITVVNESGVLSKKWIDKVTPVETIAEDIPGGYAPEEITFKGYTTKNLHHAPDAAMAFKQTIDKYNAHIIKDGVAVLNALKATDTYMQIGDLHLEQMKMPIESEVREWVSAHLKARESLERIGEFLHHMDYWDSHGHELQTLMTNYATEGQGDMAESVSLGKDMNKEPEYKDPETKKIMLRYKDFVKKATMMEPPVELGAESAAKPVDTKQPTEDKGVKQEVQDAGIPKKDPDHRATGFSMTKPFDINDNLRRQKVRYALGEGVDKSHPIVKEYDALKKNDIQTLRGIIKQQHRIVDTSEFRTKEHAISHILNNKHGHKRVASAFGLAQEDVYTSDTKQKDYMAKDAEGNWVWRKRKIHPKRVTFDASKMGGEPAQKDDKVDEAYKKKTPYQKLNDRMKTLTGKSLDDRSKEMDKIKQDTLDRIAQYKKEGILNKEEVEPIDEISQKLAGNYYGAATKKHLEKVGLKPNMYDRIEKDMGKNRKQGVDRALERVTGARKTNEATEKQSYGTWILKQKATPTLKKKKESKEKVEESVLNPNDPHGDYKAKSKAIQDIQMDPNTHKDPELKKAVMQRKADLEKEYSKFKESLDEKKQPKSLKTLKKEIKDKEGLTTVNKNPPFDAFSSTC